MKLIGLLISSLIIIFLVYFLLIKSPLSPVNTIVNYDNVQTQLDKSLDKVEIYDSNMRELQEQIP
jgi:hypothetical protein